ncbi:MAG: M24 family metallopeptidase [Chitinivibrionales bacterium]|nr:M24 family metallopeptidase [Chitinivibrionales bacterium]
MKKQQPQRIADARELLRSKKLSYLLISDPTDVEYISGFHSSNVHALISSRRSVLISDFRYRKAATGHCKQHPAWQFFEIKESSFTFLNKLLRKGARLGVQSNFLTVDQYDRLKKQCSKATIVKLRNEIPGLFLSKSDTEIKAARIAAGIADQALNRLLPRLRPGISEQEAASRLEKYCLESGSERPSFDTIVLFGTRSALPHGMPSKRTLKHRDIILIDFGCTHQGLCSDMTRTFTCGEASRLQRRMYNIVLQAQKKALAGIKAGVRARDIDKIARDYINKHNYGDQFGHATGHGVGRRIHENPRIAKKDTTLLHNGIMITVEPGIYSPRAGGVRIEDMAVVRDDGSQILTHFPKELIELPV